MDQIRPFSEKDRARIANIDNHDRPWYRRYSAEDWKGWDQQRSGQEAYQRMVIGDPAYAYLEVLDLETSMQQVAGAGEIELSVAHEKRGRGIGSLLYERGLAFAQARQLRTLEAWFYQYSPKEPGVAFLKKRGFVEKARRQTAQRNLSTFESKDFKSLFKAQEQQGIRLFPYSDLPDTQEQRRMLHALFISLGFDTANSSFERWDQARLSQAAHGSILFLAELDGVWVGLSEIVTFNQTYKIARTRFTGTRSPYSNRGIATALKVRTMEAARQQGYVMLLTSNRVDNAPILAINRKLGFEAGPLELTYVKQL